MINITRDAIGYRRLSERDQSNYSLGYQEKSIQDYCEKHGLNLLNIYTDNGESSYTFDRPDYQALENFIKKHRGQARYLIIMDHDRFSRNLKEALTKIDELEDKYGIKVLATNEDINLDPADPDVFIQRAFKYLMANQELLRIRKRTRDGIRQAQFSGRYVNVAPYGYINSRDRSGKPVLEIDEEKAAIVRFIFKQFVEGTPIYLIETAARKLGYDRNGHSAIYKLLNNCLYAGLVKVNADSKAPERLVGGIHQPIITETTYWLAQERLGKKRVTKAKPRKDFPLRGILKCRCGQNMTAGYSKGKRKYYLYYRCHVHTSKNYPGEKLHELFGEVLKLLSFSGDQIAYIQQKLRSTLLQENQNNEKIIIEREKQLETLMGKIERLEERLMNDEIDGDTYKKWRSRFRSEQTVLEENLLSLEMGSKEKKVSNAEKILPALSDLNSVFEKADLQGKQMLIQTVFKLGISYGDEKFRTPYVHPAFAHNYLKIKEKGLLEIEEPLSLLGKSPTSSP